MKINDFIYSKVHDSYGKYYEKLTGVSSKKITEDVLSFDKPIEQIEIIQKYSGSLVGKKLLEIGSGFGVFSVIARENKIEAYGVEPDSEGFNDSFSLSQDILSLNGLDKDIIKNGFGEDLPFQDNLFDVVFSTNVLEHVKDPKDFISEAIRVCKPGGMVQIVVPNYGSFYDGHYSSFYIPYQPKWLWKIFIKVFHKKDVSYIDTLRTEINYFSIKRYLKRSLKEKVVTEITYGEEVFVDRMNGINFTAWAGLEKVNKWLNIVNKFKLVKFMTSFMILTKSFSPLIITLKKNE